MPSFSKKSLAQLNTCHSELQRLFKEVIKTYDCTIIEGHRSKEAQEAAFAAGKSKLHYPQGKHNSDPSLAVDVVPYPTDWNNAASFRKFASFVLGMAETMGVHIRWGGAWDGTPNKPGQLDDLDHFELIEKYLTSAE